MASNIHMDDLRVSAIERGIIYFAVRSGDEVLRFSQPVGDYRAFIARTARQIDDWIAAQREPAEFTRGHG